MPELFYTPQNEGWKTAFSEGINPVSLTLPSQLILLVVAQIIGVSKSIEQKQPDSCGNLQQLTQLRAPLINKKCKKLFCLFMLDLLHKKDILSIFWIKVCQMRSWKTVKNIFTLKKSS